MFEQKNFLEFLKNKKLVSIILFLIVMAGISLTINNYRKNADTAISASANSIVDNEKYAIDENTKNFHPSFEWLQENPQDIDVTANSAIVIDENTGNVLFAKNEHDSLPPASITKIMTAIIASENINKNDLCTVSEKAAATEPNKIVMKEGERLRSEDLLYGLMMISANDAAEVLAESIDGNRQTFINLMNEKVRLLGLNSTDFKNPSGLDEEGHLSSAFDIAVMTRYAIKSYPEILSYMGEKEDYSVYPTEENESHWWSHISSLLYNYRGADGVKTGYTENANHTLIATAQREGKRIIIVYFGSSDSTGDAVKLLDLGFSINTGV